jgi:hypothetical protein
MRTRKTQNIKINMTCGSDFRLKKLYLFLHIFLTFSRENSRLDTSPPMMKSVWSHLKSKPNVPWLTSTIKKQIRERDGLKSLAIRHQSENYWNAYKTSTTRATNALRETKLAHYKGEFNPICTGVAHNEILAKSVPK